MLQEYSGHLVSCRKPLVIVRESKLHIGFRKDPFIALAQAFRCAKLSKHQLSYGTQARRGAPRVDDSTPQVLCTASLDNLA